MGERSFPWLFIKGQTVFSFAYKLHSWGMNSLEKALKDWLILENARVNLGYIINIVQVHSTVYRLK